jgi:hypothetical protein
MRYLKLFKNFILEGQTQAQAQPQQKPGWGPSKQEPGWAPPIPDVKPGQRNQIEETSLYEEVLFMVENKMSDPEFATKFEELSNLLRSEMSNEKMYAIFGNIMYSSGFLGDKLNENNLNDFAKQALLYIVSIGAMALAVKLFYKLGNVVFQNLDEAGFSSVGGGVLLILIYLAFFHKVKKKSQIEEENDDMNNPPMLEKRSKKEGEETLRASSFAYVPDKDKPSTWKLRIDDATHVRSAVAALGKGFRGNKVEIPADEKDSVIRKVRKAYKKFYPEKVSEEGYPKALELK